ESEPRIEPRRIPLHRRVDQPLDFGELHDRVELAIDLPAREAEEAGAEIDVLAARELRVKTGAQLDERHDMAADPYAAARRPGDPRDELQQGGLPGAISADDAQAGAARNFERHLTQRVDRRVDGAAGHAVNLGRRSAQPVDSGSDELDQRARAAGAITLG